MAFFMYVYVCMSGGGLSRDLEILTVLATVIRPLKRSASVDAGNFSASWQGFLFLRDSPLGPIAAVPALYTRDCMNLGY